MIDFNLLMRFAFEQDASDIHLQAGMKPNFRIGGILRTAEVPPITDDELHAFIESIAPKRFKGNVADRMVAGLDFSYAAPGIGRFRCSAYHQLGQAGIAMRTIKSRIPTVAELNLPPIISEIAMAGRGLTLVTGTTGSGKSTTLAAMIDLINQHNADKIISIEDPVEYMHTPKLSMIAQLEVGTDTTSFEQALRQSLRQDPDVVLVGELRDMETLRIALRAADTGHQVFSTVHSANAPQTIERIIAMFPPAEHKLLLTQLAGNLEAIISQRLIICHDGSRRPAVEVLRGGPVPQKYILEGRALELGDYIKNAGGGMQTFDQNLLAMHRAGYITIPEALKNATNPDQLSMMLRGISGNSGSNASNNRQGVLGGPKPPRPPITGHEEHHDAEHGHDEHHPAPHPTTPPAASGRNGHHEPAAHHPPART